MKEKKSDFKEQAEESWLSYVFSYVKRGVQNLSKFSKGECITFGIIVIIWVVTGLLKSLNIDIPFVRALAFFTASYNGMDNGILSITGGITAKSFVIAAVSGTLIPLATSLFSVKRNTEYAGFFRFARSLKTIRFKSKSHLAMLLFGTGIALVFYSFLSVDGSFQNNFAAVLAALSIIKNFGSKNSFLSGLLSIVLRKTMLAVNGADIVMAGMVTGFILSVPISLKLSAVNGIGYIVGGAAVTAGLVLLMSGRPERRVGQTI